MAERISIVIPAHNEEKRISRTLENYLFYFRELRDKNFLDFEIIVVLNNCNDRTFDVVQRYKCNELKILDFKTGGKGFAVIEGFKEALKGSSAFLGFVDADMATPPNAFYGLIRNLGNYDGIIANRWDERSKITNYGLLRKITSRGYNSIIRAMFFLPFKDTQCGAKVFRRKIIQDNIHKIISSQWNFDIALLFCLRKESNARIKTIPTEWSDVVGSKINIRKAPINMFLSAVRLRMIHSPFRNFVRIYHNLPEKWKIR